MIDPSSPSFFSDLSSTTVQNNTFIATDVISTNNNLLRPGISNDQLEHIFSFLPTYSLGQYTSVCRAFYSAIEMSEYKLFNIEAKKAAVNIFAIAEQEIRNITSGFSANTSLMKTQLPFMRLFINDVTQINSGSLDDKIDQITTNMFALTASFLHHPPSVTTTSSQEGLMIKDNHQIESASEEEYSIQLQEYTKRVGEITNIWSIQEISFQEYLIDSIVYPISTFENQQAKKFVDLCLLYVKEIIQSADVNQTRYSDIQAIYPVSRSIGHTKNSKINSLFMRQFHSFIDEIEDAQLDIEELQSNYEKTIIHYKNVAPHFIDESDIPSIPDLDRHKKRVEFVSKKLFFSEIPRDEFQLFKKEIVECAQLQEIYLEKIRRHQQKYLFIKLTDTKVKCELLVKQVSSIKDFSESGDRLDILTTVIDILKYLKTMRDVFQSKEVKIDNLEKINVYLTSLNDYVENLYKQLDTSLSQQLE